ncbi:MAG: DUF342 domain-containing protein [Candidatus Magnetomorum sp.]|nr:DUF342 domain-containing protein [Candidatus Magnetomorum sp.]
MNREQIHHIEGNLSSRKKQYNYPGQLKIDGDIEAGCQVSAETIEANNIFQADIRVRSGILVHEQVIDSTIMSSGKFEAKSIDTSTIRVEQDIIVQKIIHHSNIQTNACCLITNGCIESSNILAYQAIDALTITGSSESACTLTIGLLCPDDQDLKLKKTYLQLEYEKKQLLTNLEQAELSIENILRLKDKVRSIKPTLKQKIIHLKETNNQGSLNELAPFFQQLNERMASAFENLTRAFSDKERILKEIESFNQELLDASKKEYHLRKKDRIYHSIQNQTVIKPYILVRGMLGKNTYIIGLHSQKRLLEDMHNVRIQETELNIPNHPSNAKHYTIDIKSQKENA